MFEKESEGYAEEHAFRIPYDGSDKFYDDKDYECSEEGFQKGALFGYNKANEWHYVKDEGLPVNKSDGTTYLLYTIYGEGGSPVVAHFAYRDKQELMNIWTGAILTEDKIIAWKEIVLPKETSNG